MPDFEILTEEKKQYIARLEEEVADLNAKLNYIGDHIETEEGMFSFPDGDYIFTKRKIVVPSELKKKRIPGFDRE